ncbi:MAG TPA: sigma-70 family RNA polymerase sigma factor [Steroidobacteraceae bacterium]|nr:sigma-70 family RNA polymerase sigma factor [Steroidobacteraceae bacterium]
MTSNSQPVLMQTNEMGEVTRLLHEWSGGSDAALASLFPLIYDDLRAMANRHLRRERSEHTLQRTALVHEAFLRMVDQRQVTWEGRSQFFAIASQMMRRILVDHARRRSAAKRGDRAEHLSLDDLIQHDEERLVDSAGDAISLGDAPRVDFEAIDTVLKRLEVMDPQQGKLVELRFFGGLSIKDTADVIGVSPATVKREWAIARAWLQRELHAEERV